MQNDSLIDELNKLIQLDFDASKTYEQAIKKIDDPAVRDDLEQFRLDHVRHINHLSTLVLDLGGTPVDPRRDFKGLLLESMTWLRSATGTKGALKAMRMNERLTNTTYRKASDVDVPPRVRNLLEDHLADERRHLASIDMHLQRLGVDVLDADDELLRMPPTREPPGAHP
jgi:rubrerythrin